MRSAFATSSSNRAGGQAAAEAAIGASAAAGSQGRTSTRHIIGSRDVLGLGVTGFIFLIGLEIRIRETIWIFEFPVCQTYLDHLSTSARQCLACFNQSEH